jgi:hypothetical protein
MMEKNSFIKASIEAYHNKDKNLHKKEGPSIYEKRIANARRKRSPKPKGSQKFVPPLIKLAASVNLSRDVSTGTRTLHTSKALAKNVSITIDNSPKSNNLRSSLISSNSLLNKELRSRSFQRQQKRLIFRHQKSLINSRSRRESSRNSKNLNNNHILDIQNSILPKLRSTNSQKNLKKPHKYKMI